MNKETKILTNVFLNTTEDKVVPVNIYFDGKIQKIEKLSNNEYNLNEIILSDNPQKYFNYRELAPNLEIIDGEFNLVIPGAIDPHVHFDTPGFEFRDTFEHGTTAAAYGGVTSIIDMPCTSLPPVTSLKNFEEKLNIIEGRALVDFAFWGGVCGNDFSQMQEIEKNINDLNDAGVASYKAYFLSGMETFKDLNYEQMKFAAKIISKTSKPLGVHAEDKMLVETRRTEFIKNGENSWDKYCSARDSLAEEAAIKDMIEIAKFSKARVHIVHLSSELGLNAIKNAQKEDINISSETCPHYLHFIQDDFNKIAISNFLKTAPPVKNENDRNALWQGIEDNSLFFVTTDHAGCDPNVEKVSGNFWKIYGGIPGVEHRVPYLFSEGFLKGRLNLSTTINLLSANVAEYFGLQQKGRIEEGYDADFAILNLREKELVKSENMHSKGKYTPFEGVEFSCIVEKTILRGNTVMNRGGSTEKEIGYGKFIKV